MKAMRLAEASEKFRGIGFDQTRDLTPPERDSWDRAGAPEVVLASRPLKSRPGAADPSAELLAKADGYARREGISRAELIARGLTAILPKDRSDRKTG